MTFFSSFYLSPLYIASEKNHPEMVALLLEYNADPDKPKSDGATPLYVASERTTLKWSPCY